MGIKLKLLPLNEYIRNDRYDPLRFYRWPIFGKLYRRRVELCLSQCSGGRRVLEVGYGSGVTFFNLNDLYDEIYGLDLNVPAEELTAWFKSRGVNVRLSQGNVVKIPYEDGYFDTVILISILEHLYPEVLPQAMSEILRVLKQGGEMIYGVPIDRPFMSAAFRLLGYNIRKHHFSSEKDVRLEADKLFKQIKSFQMASQFSLLGPLYEVASYLKK